MANDFIKFSRTEYEVVGGKFDMQNLGFEWAVDLHAGYLSPVSDAYKKVGLSKRRILSSNV